MSSVAHRCLLHSRSAGKGGFGPQLYLPANRAAIKLAGNTCSKHSNGHSLSSQTHPKHRSLHSLRSPQELGVLRHAMPPQAFATRVFLKEGHAPRSPAAAAAAVVVAAAFSRCCLGSCCLLAPPCKEGLHQCSTLVCQHAPPNSHVGVEGVGSDWRTKSGRQGSNCFRRLCR